MNDNTDLIVACPECDSAGVKCNVCTDLQGPTRDDTTKHRCEDCGHRFPDYEAIRREPKVDVPPRGDSLARTLYDADPDDLATDGGSVHGENDEKGRPCKHAMDRFDILHLFADTGVEDEVLHTFGNVLRVGIDPEPNPFSTVVQGDACDPPVSGSFDLAVAHPPCQRWSVATPGGGSDPEDHPDYIDDARRVCRGLADHYIIENVRDAPLHDPVHLTGGMFGLAIHYPRAFETSFPVRQPQNAARWRPDHGPLAEQGKHGNAWVGTNDGWRLAKGYGHDWPGRGLKRHAVPAPYLRRLLYWWLAALDGDSPPEQATINALADGGTDACRECGRDLGAGYLCDDCDRLEVLDS